MLILSQSELFGLLSPLQVVDAVDEALRAQAAGQVIMPKRMHVSWADNTLLTMPAIADDCCAVKLVSVVPGNAARGLPVTSGVMLLNDAMTGEPLALMNAGALTAQRTGAVGALGVKYMTEETLDSLGIVGCGVQGAWHAIFGAAVRPIRNVFCIARSSASFERFKSSVQTHAPALTITPCADARELLQRTRLVIAATTSSTPVLPDDAELLWGKQFISVGSFKPTMQELPDSVYRLAGALAVDSPHAAAEVGDVINPLQRGILRPENIFSIAECVTGARTFDRGRTNVYKAVGAAVYDLYVANALYRCAKARNVGCEVTV